jgi:Zn-dependent peptidase ImmA (M78 family)
MATSRAEIPPAVLRWARESAGYGLDQAAAKLAVSVEKLGAAERGERYLTLRQAENAARAYGRPLASLFLPHPPNEEPVEQQFRRLPGAPRPPWPPAMRLLARLVTARQDAAVSIYEDLDESPPWLDFDAPFVSEATQCAAQARLALDVSLEEQRSWRDARGYEALASWRRAVEATGVLVMQDGSLPVAEMRGFAALHARVPAIVLNTKDDPRARVFTLIHEFGHLLRSRAGQPVTRSDEAWCEQFAGALLMPREPFMTDLAKTRGSGSVGLDAIDELARTYGVTPAATAVRAARLALLPRAESNAILAAIRQRSAGRSSSPGGGDYYRNAVARLGPSFTRLVLSGLNEEAVTSAGAADLLQVKVDHFPALIERLGDPAQVV